MHGHFLTSIITAGHFLKSSIHGILGSFIHCQAGAGMRTSVLDVEAHSRYLVKAGEAF
jgi:hypothetical protein